VMKSLSAQASGFRQHGGVPSYLGSQSTAQGRPPGTELTRDLKRERCTAVGCTQIDFPRGLLTGSDYMCRCRGAA
jgi:hypothetical protein